MSKMATKLSPIKIMRAIELLSPEELETLLILMDRELTGELFVRRQEAKDELKNRKLKSKQAVFKERNN